MYSKQSQLINQLSQIYTGHCRYKTNIEKFMICTTPQKSEFTHDIYEPALCVVLQGAKEIEFANQNLYFDPSRFLLTLSYVPVYARFVNVSSDKPYFALTLKFSLNQVYEVLKELDGKFLTPNSPSKHHSDSITEKESLLWRNI